MKSQPGFKIHTSMQDANNLDFAFGFQSIKNNMTSDIAFFVALADFTTVFPFLRIGGYLMETGIELS